MTIRGREDAPWFVTDDAIDISVIIPTYNRASALRLNLPYVLALEGVQEIVVAIDGSTDDTEQVLAGFGDERLRVLRHSERRGSQATRKTAIAAARGQWLLMLDDDCAAFEDFARILRETADRHHADVVAAPWVFPDPGVDPHVALERARLAPGGRTSLRSNNRAFPKEDVETPFLPGNVLISRRVFDRVGYDEGFRGNAWREETSLYLDAQSAGFRCILTPRTASFQLGQWSGGQRLPRLEYEALVVRNNWRFLRRHGRQLRALKEIRSPALAQLDFVVRRALMHLRGMLRARLRRE